MGAPEGPRGPHGTCSGGPERRPLKQQLPGSPGRPVSVPVSQQSLYLIALPRHLLGWWEGVSSHQRILSTCRSCAHSDHAVFTPGTWEPRLRSESRSPWSLLAQRLHNLPGS